MTIDELIAIMEYKKTHIKAHISPSTIGEVVEVLKKSKDSDTEKNPEVVHSYRLYHPSEEQKCKTVLEKVIPCNYEEVLVNNYKDLCKQGKGDTNEAKAVAAKLADIISG